MKIQNIQISAFGEFNHRKFDFSQGNFCLIYGPNEAGKSTFLEMVRSLVFDTDQTSSLYSTGFTPELSCNLTFQLSDGSSGSLTRSWNATASRCIRFMCQIRRSHETAFPETITEQDFYSQFLSGANRSLFCNFFGFSHLELTQGGSILKDTDLSDLFYGAGFGGPKLYQELKKRLSRETEQLFTPSGRNKKEINRLYREMTENRQTIKKHMVDAGSYTKCRQEYSLVVQKLEEQRKTLKQLEQDIRLYEKLVQGFDCYQNIQSYKLHCDNLVKESHFPESILQKFSSCDSASLFGISAAMESLETELITLEQQEQNQQKQLESIVRHPEILSCQDEWNRLNKQIQSVIETRETLPGLKVKRENQKRDFDQAVKTLGIPNPEKQLRDFVFSNQLKENLDRLKNEEETISDGLKLVTNDIKEKQRQQNEIRQKIQSQPEYLNDDSSVAIKNLLEETEVLLKQEPLLKHNSEQIKQLTDKLNEESRQEEKLRSILLQAIPEQRKDWDLSQVIPPFEAELNEFESQFQQLEKKVSELDIKQEQYQLRGQEIMQQLEQLTIDSNVPDEKELQIARKNRDMLWDQLKSLITGISGQSIIELPGHISDKKKSENIEAISTSTPETGSGLNIFSATNVEEDSSPDTVPFIPLKVTRPEPVSETFNSLFMKDEIKQNLSLSSPSSSTNEKKPEDRIPEYESAVKRADTIIDIRFKNAQSIIQQKNFQAELRRCQDSVQQLEKEKQSLRITRDKLQIQWRSFCKTRNLPVETMSVALLKEWFKTRENWQRSIDQIHKINQEIDSVKDRLSDWESECHKIFKMFLSIVPSGTFDSEPDILAENRFSNKNEIPDTVCHLQKLFKKLNDWKEKLSARVQEHDAILLDYKKIEDNCQKSQRRLNEIIQQQSEWNKRRIEITTFLGFPEDWSTSNIDHCIKNIETLQRDQKDLAELSQQIELATDRLHRFAQQVNELGLLLGMESTPDVWPEAILSQLKTRFDEALEAETEFQSVRSKLSELQESIQIHKKQLSQKQKQNQELLTRYNLKTNNEFVKLGQTAEEYQKSKKELLSQEETLRLIFINQEKEYQHSLSLFAQTTKENLTETLYKLQQQRETCNDQINLLYSCEGTQKQSMTQLEQSEGAVSYLRKQEQLTGQFRDAVYQYIPRLFALKLLEASYIKYENEWQPEILERANSLFSKMTDGRYQHVRHSSGTDTFEVDDTKRGLIKKTNELSTATREQLYLAVRLAHILHYSHHAEPLPFVIDDILVNFDDHRKEITLNVLHELADQFQIIFLTCNQSTLTHFQKTFSDSTVLLL